ncbi:MAG: hypothetical protein Q8O62_04375 [Aequorivita sp.]|nr:hypothetical protein [Aequorivita sp.]
METTSPKFFCFVLMPFHKSFDDIYQLGIKDSCNEVNAYCERVDEQFFEERMTDRIYNQIAKADLVIADMTGKNPNVFYEVGYAHALNKPTILLTQKSEDIPFDLKDYPHIIYDGSIQNIKSELPKRIQWYMEHQNEKAFLKNDLEILIDGKTLKDNKLIIERIAPLKYLDFTIHNKSLKYYAPEEYQVAVIFEGILQISKHNEHLHRYTPLEKGKNLNIIPTWNAIYPNGYEVITLHFQMPPEEGIIIYDFEIRIYTLSNELSFNFNLKIKPNPKTKTKHITSSLL